MSPSVVPPLRPENFEEKIVYHTIVWTWGLYLIGGLYVAAPVVGWTLAAVSIYRMLGFDPAYHGRRITVPFGVWVWIYGMAVMAAALIIAHQNYELGTAATIKSFIGWMKGWALFPVFAFVGATMKIRSSILFRASNICAAHTLFFATPILLILSMVGLPRVLYVSPLQMIGGPGPEFFSVITCIADPETGTNRFQYFAPWAPAAAVVASLALVCAIFEKDVKWRTIGIISALAVCIMSQSRMAIVAVPATYLMIILSSNATRSKLYFAGGLFIALLIPFFDDIIDMVDQANAAFNGARPGSTRVRATLQRIALDRWWHEAPVFGHGIVERGPHLVEFMPIGSHHTWNGLLFVKGAVGYAALAIPLIWSVLELFAKAQMDRLARAALMSVVLISFFSMGENLEILVYLFWPSIILIGMAMRRRFFNPFGRRLTGIPAATVGA